MRLRQHGRSPLLRNCLQYVGIAFLTWSLLETITIRNAIVREASKEPPPFGKQKIFISSILWTNAIVLVPHWIPALVALAEEIGRENVFISIAESGSLDNTKEALRWLDSLLEEAGISRRIVLDDETHLDAVSRRREPGEDGWIFLPHGEWEVRRIPYLSKQRNLALQPLWEMEEQGFRFDRVLFLNDVVFNTTDVKRLLDTRGGEYAAACSLDFKHAGEVYDTMALRDAAGNEPMMLQWPFFRSKLSRQAMRASQPVPVMSCWNGIVAMNAAPFYDKGHPLTFRGVTDELARRHVEGSECCLIHPDNPRSQSEGVWLNPNVRVGYDLKAYEAMNQGETAPWVSSLGIVYGSWKNKMLRWMSWPSSLEVRLLGRLVEWESRSVNNREPGAMCLIDEMQVLTWNGWAHV